MATEVQDRARNYIDHAIGLAGLLWDHDASKALADWEDREGGLTFADPPEAKLQFCLAVVAGAMGADSSEEFRTACARSIKALTFYLGQEPHLSFEDYAKAWLAADFDQAAQFRTKYMMPGMQFPWELVAALFLDRTGIKKTFNYQDNELYDPLTLKVLGLCLISSSNEVRKAYNQFVKSGVGHEATQGSANSSWLVRLFGWLENFRR